MAEADVQSDREEAETSDYIPDPQALWGAEGTRALLVVLTRRLGGDFAREVHNEIFARTMAYEEGCPDDRRDAATLERLLKASFWDALFACKPA